MAGSDLEICKQALIDLGENPIDSFDEGTSNATTCATTYPDFRKAMLAIRPWKFLKKTRQLARLAGVDPIGWNAAFAFPSDRLDTPEAFFIDVSGTRLTRYEVLGEQVNTDFEELWCRYNQDVPEAKWPPLFTSFVIKAYAASIAVPVTEEQSLATRLETAAWGDTARRDGGLFKQAKAADGRLSPQRSMLEDGGPLIRARQGGLGNSFAGIIE